MASKTSALIQVMVTDNSEYYVSLGHCTAVRSNRTGEWKSSHPAIGSELLGSLDVATLQAYPDRAVIGAALIFGDVVTSPLCSMSFITFCKRQGEPPVQASGSLHAQLGGVFLIGEALNARDVRFDQHSQVAGRQVHGIESSALGLGLDHGPEERGVRA